MAVSDSRVAEALKAALRDTSRLREQNRQLTAAAREPIAIVSMACRFPGGVRSPEDLWNLVTEGRDGITEFPADRGWDLPGADDPRFATGQAPTAWRGGFLPDIDQFDAGLFGISPREAYATDPQQRHVLEASWEAVERAGIAPSALRGTQTGVFIGCSTGGHNDGYPHLLRGTPDADEGHLMTGNANSVISGRIAYSLGLEGPALTIDTACSSALVALHLASRALRQGECEMALVGGVTLMASPEIFVGFAQQGGLAVDGQCKSFADAADGTVFSEGVAILAVERLSDARRKGHPVLAVLRGSAVNQDGTSNGLTAPSGIAQQRVIRQALANADLRPHDVDAVEAHGTGTTLGDPIEAHALLATYGRERDPRRPLWLGSVKSNIGHTQAAAGVAGVVKMVMALRAGLLPASLHADTPSTHVDWSAGGVSLLDEARPWTGEEGHPRRAGVSSFGISGTNAHIILEEAPPAEPTPDAPQTTALPAAPIPLSGRDDAALRAQARQLATWLTASPDAALPDVGFSLATGRSALARRAVVVASDRDTLRADLAALAESDPRVDALVGSSNEGGRTAFLFTGQGAQRIGMGRELYETFPVFAESFDAVCAELDGHLQQPLKSVVFGDDADLLNQTVFAQAALFAVEVSLFRLVESWGVRPEFLAGHSIGEVSAAYCAGVWSLADACALVAARGRLMQSLPAGGAMVAIQATEDELGELPEGVGIAAINGPTLLVVSGAEQAVTELAEAWKRQGRKTKRLAVSHAFHSPLMEPVLEEFRQAIADLSYAAPSIALVSNVTGELATAEQVCDPGYWVRHIREAVRFADGVRVLYGEGVRTFLELGPDGVLSAAGAESVDDALFAPTLRGGRGEAETLLAGVGRAWAAGARVNWADVFAGTTAHRVDVPTYAFQRERFWPAASARVGDVSAAGLGRAEHPLLGASVALADSEGFLLTGRLSVRTHPWLADHQVAGRVVVPGTGLLELVMHAGGQAGSGMVEELTLQAPLVLPADGDVIVQVSVGGPDEDGRRSVSVHSRSDGDPAAAEGWVHHAAGVLGREREAETFDLSQWPPTGATEVDLSDLYPRLTQGGVEYGPAFRGLRKVWRADGEVCAEVSLPETMADEAARYGIHPALLDAVLHAVAVGGVVPGDGVGRLPFVFGGVSWWAVGASVLRVRLRGLGGESLSIEVADGAGRPVGEVASLGLRAFSADAVANVGGVGDSLFGVEWVGVEVPAHAGAGAEWREVWAVDAASAVGELQEWLAGDETGSLVVVTRGGVDPLGAGGVVPEAAGVWGLVRALQAEEPGRVVLVDVDPGVEAGEGLAGLGVSVEGLLGLDEPGVAVRDGGVWVPRLARVIVPVSEPAGGESGVGSGLADGTVLVSGGSGVLAGLVAEHVVARYGASRLVLASRRGVVDEELLGRLTELGAVVDVVACDVADRAAVTEVVASLATGEFPLRGVVHAAGVLEDGVFSSLDRERLGRVWGPKVEGAITLDEVTRELGVELDLFVVFSSAAGVLGNAGQAAYGAANAYVDALVARRREQGLPGVSMAWGLWDVGGGMGGTLGEADTERLGRAGVRGFTAEEGLALFDASLRSDLPLTVPVKLDLAALRAGAAATGTVPAMYRGLVRAPARKASRAAVVTDAGWAGRLAGLDEAGRRRLVLDVVREQVAGVLGYAQPGAIEAGQSFTDLGLDSLTAVELRNRLAAVMGVRLPATLVFDYPSSEVLTDFLVREVVGELEDVDTPSTTVVRAGVADEPIAIVGMACRYPGGVTSPEDLWELVAAGTDAVVDFPADRGWDLDGIYDPDPGHTGTTYTRRGGFLGEVSAFDPRFFGLSPREALATDPQQRLLLETSWEAFERAGIDPTSLRGSQTGVFTGLMYHDYPELLQSMPEAEGAVGSGDTASIASGRLSYTFGLEGPAVTVDTACSSSLVALHLAVQALRSGECELALAGGVTVMATPGTFIGFARQRGLSVDGRCKSFSEQADGVGWGEGVGMLLVERLSDAQRLGHPVLAVVRGSAVNQDGASNGLTAPNGPSQQRVIRQALANARLSATDVDVVEGHGTGTTLGDPIEAQALLATYGQQRAEDRPLLLGSLKSNIGHTQAAAGVAGVIKMVMAMRNATLPRTLHADEPSSHVDWSAGAVTLLTEERPWAAEEGRVRRAAVSSFGISGTNAHTIIEEAPATPGARQPTGASMAPSGTPVTLPAVPVSLSAADPAALRDQAQRLLDHLTQRDELPLADVAFSLATGRAALHHRATLVAADRERLAADLRSLAQGTGPSAGVVGAATGGRTAFLFTGQGAQRVGMGRELYETFPVFAASFDAVCGELDRHLEQPLKGVVFGENAELLNQTVFAQAALFAVEVSLFRLVESWGVRPDFLAGHSIGEVAAAYCAGVWSLADACALVAARGRLMQSLPAGGAMVAIQATEDELGELPEGVGIAAINGPSSLVVSGVEQAVVELADAWKERGRKTHRLKVSHAFHSPLMEPVLEEFRQVIAGLSYEAPAIPLVSNVTGELATVEQVRDPGYWVRHIREAVRFADGVATLHREGVRVFVELGPDGVLSAAGAESAEQALFASALRKGREEVRTLLTALGQVWTHGVTVDWAAFFAGTGARRVELPTYAFQHENFWPELPAGPRERSAAGVAEETFWRAVEDEDAGGLADTLGVDAEGRGSLESVLPVLSSWWRGRRARGVVDGWRYGVEWHPTSHDAFAAGVLAGRWLVAVAKGCAGDELSGAVCAALVARGAEAVVVEVPPAGGRTGAAAALAGVVDEGVPVAGVVSLLGVVRGMDAGVSLGAAGTLGLMQGLGDAGVGGQLWCVTRGAVSVGGEAVDPASAQVWGLGLAAGLEHPDGWGGLVDLPSSEGTEDLAGAVARLVDVVAADQADDQVAVRSGAVLARRVVRVADGGGAEWRPRGAVVVTGGTGGLGARVARWAAEQGAEHLVLTSRRGDQAPGARELAASLAELGVGVTLAACDMGDRASVAGMLAALPQDVPLTAVVHAAGVDVSGLVDDLDVDALGRAAGGKVVGAALLDELLGDRELDAFVLFSSVAGVLGGGGVGAYGAANAYLDGLAAARRARGLVGTSIAWGPWAEVGMAVADQVSGQAGRRGMRHMDPDTAVSALGPIVGGGNATELVADADWQRLADIYGNTLLEELIDKPAADATTGTADAASPLLAELSAMGDEDRERRLTHLVRAEVAVVLGYREAEVQAERAFRDMGFDSLTGVELRNRLNAVTGLRLATTLVFDHPTPRQLAAHLRTELFSASAALAVQDRPLRADTDEPIAIVSMSCRYPGGIGSPEELWQLLAEGRDVVTDFPTDRGWDLDDLYDPEPDRSGKTYSRRGAFLADMPDFDAAFFGISPREATAMDPQQRLLLETSWEAFERAGLNIQTLRGSQTGVFVGISGSDYGTLLMQAPPETAEAYGAAGNAGSVMSGRLSYTFGFEGPAVTVDTACSSSLVAMHLAAQALRQGECDLALAGGVTVMSGPSLFVEFSRQRGLSVDGRCKSFADSADGVGWGEGVGLLVLERLSDARRHGHQVLAVVRGSAVNQDGASNGLTAPNGPSQQRVIQQALAGAGLSATDVDVVEAHGTGTRLGDPIEAQALLATYGRQRPADQPLLLGSIKSNIGHTQAAAGVAGVIKMVMAMRNETLPRTLHVDQPSGQVDWSSGAVSLLTDAHPWVRADGRARRAGVSSFGISGTNAHTIIEEPPTADIDTAGDTTPTEAPGHEPSGETATAAAEWNPFPVLLSGHDEAALRAQASRLCDHLGAAPDLRLADVAHSLATSRAALPQRAVLIAADRERLTAELRAVAEGEPRFDVAVSASTPAGARLALLFTGQGAQRIGMGRDLHDRFPAFAATFDEVCAELDRHLERPLRSVLWAADAAPESDDEPLDQTVFAQAALFAVEVSLFRLLETWGIRPEYLAGHSIGEVSAAYCAGVWSLTDACALVAARGRLMQSLPEGGAMVAIQATEAELGALPAGMGIAAINSPTSLVVSGEEEPANALAAHWREQGRKVRKLRVSHAFHSPLMEPVLEEFRQAISGLTFQPPAIPLVSNVTGELATVDQVCDPDYWVGHIREAVRFADGVATLYREGVRTFVELGPDGVLSAAGAEVIEGEDGEGTLFAPAMRAGRGEVETLLMTVGRAWAHGATVDWPTLFATAGGHRVDLPTYAFQRQRFWPVEHFAIRPEPRTEARQTGADEAAFWTAVADQDLSTLTDTLGVDAEGRGSLESVLPVLSSWWRRRRARGVVDGWRYGVEWRPVQRSTDGVLGGRWLVAVAEGCAGDELSGAVCAALVARGAEAVVVEVPPAGGRTGAAAALAGVVDEGVPVAGVVSLLGVVRGMDAGVSLGVAGTLGLVQGLGDAGVGGRLWCVTRSATPAGEEVVDPASAQVWGLGLAAALEQPDRWGGLVDLPEAVDAATADALATVLTSDETQVAVRSGAVLARRVVRVADGGGAEWRPRGTVVVTGGTGGLGARVARWAAEQGAEHLVLTSRRGDQAPGARELAASLAELGVGVTLAACDMGDRASVAGMLAALPQDVPLTAVVHAAGVDVSGLLGELDADALGRAAGGKVVGAALLDELLGDRELDAFVLFSSVAGLFGGGGAGAYGAANAYLDGLAAARRARGLAGTSIAWGPWAEVGMAVADNMAGQTGRRGMRQMDPDLAVSALSLVVGGGNATEMVADADWQRVAGIYGTARIGGLLSDIVETPAQDTTAPAADTQPPLLAELGAMGAGERERRLTRLVCAEAAVVLGYGVGSGEVQAERAFRDMGFDSLTGVELRNRLGVVTGLKLASSLVFDHPSPRQLAVFLSGELFGGSADVVGVVDGGGTARGEVDEPIAIVGMACRFPGGVGSPEELWRLLSDGADAIGEFPQDRGWDTDGLFDPDPGRSGTSTTRFGAFLSGAAEFDAGFFGISPREALAMDPQQRLLLETGWEALERAGLNATDLRGSQTGVFIGSNGQDYASLLAASPDATEGYGTTGSAASVVSGRLSYTFGFEGPAVTVDTACSSSLVALHLAAQALRQGECDMALAGGVTLMSTPALFVEFSRQRGLAVDGRCKSFADAADGTGWGEGAGVLVVERLSDARRNGHQVLAVVRGSAVNQDGASNGLTAPNGPAQQRVIRQALTSAGITASDVDVVEAHGTGTRLGDPIEAQALLATYGQDRPQDRPLWLGSVKSNIGHTQAAAGVAGVIKMVMAMRHGLVPRTLHVDEPSTQVDWSAGSVSLLTEPLAWEPQEGRVRRAGISSFGISGTNAHTIIEEAPTTEPDPTPATPAIPPVTLPMVPVLLSAADEEGLRAQAERLHTHLTERPELGITDVAFTLATHRAPLGARLALAADDRDRLLADLRTTVERTSATWANESTETAFLFTGQGAQRVGMGRELYEAFPVFTESFNAVCAELDRHLEQPLRDVVFGEDAELLSQTVFAQAALFAVEVSLFRLVESWGVRPDFLAGHSIGEVSAAYCAGVWSLADACTLVAARGRLMQSLPAGGAMVAIQATEAELGELPEGVGIAAVNGPTSLVISGAEQAVTELAEIWKEQGRKTHRLKVSHAFHSPLMEPVLEEFRQVIAGLSYEAPAIPLVSNVTGELATTEQVCAPGYWVRHIREAVRFADGVATLHREGVRTFLELGPDGVLSAAGAETAEDAVFAPTLRKGRGESETLLSAVGRAWAHGVVVPWGRLFDGTGARSVDLPTYAFQHQRYWPTPAPSVPSGSAGSPQDDAFWQAVAHGDLGSLTDTLRLDDDQRESFEHVLPVLSSWHQTHQQRTVIDGWRYRTTWQAFEPTTQPSLTGRWLLAHDPSQSDSDLLHTVADALGAHGAEVVRWEVATRTPERGALAGQLAAYTAQGAVTGVLSFLGLVEEALPESEAASVGLAATLVLSQALGDADLSARLWCLTQGAVSTGRTDAPVRPRQTQVWGLGRVIGLEAPHRWGGLADLPATVDERSSRRLIAVLAGEGTEDQTAIRSTGTYARRLVRAPRATATSQSAAWSPRGTVLITGGTGGLGAAVARWAAANGAEHLVLTSRRGREATGASELERELSALGAKVTIAACDVAERDAVATLLDVIPGKTLNAVVHAAGVSQNREIQTISTADLIAAGAGKAAGAAHLDELLGDQPLDAFITFSSIAAAWGSASNGAYAAANAFLDGLVENRHQRGLAATSLAWGPWAEVGMATSEDTGHQLGRRGLGMLPPTTAVQALAVAVGSGGTCEVIADVDWTNFAPIYTSTRAWPLLDEIPEARDTLTEAETEDPTADRSLLDELSNLPSADQQRKLVTLVCAEAASVLGHAGTDQVKPNRPFRDIGFDSLTAVELRNALGSATGVRLPATLIFDYPTPAALAGRLHEDLFAGATHPAAPQAGTGTLASELDRLEARLATADIEDNERADIATRLQRILADWSVQSTPSDDASIAETLEAATSDEVFDFIDKQFGIS
ncbi:type I polyketide synthase [Streptomyces buecherae]|uniref:type I polyketide synthase n=1 Tax=Streptomyces buecherae TaxID=2763006 RepID=UPI003684D310